MSGKIKFLLIFLYTVGFSLLLKALTVGKNMGILDPQGVIALKEINLIYIATFFMLIVVIPVFVLTFIFAWKYNEKNSEAKYAPSEDHNSLEEFIWWIIPCVIIIILGTITWKSTHELDPYRPLVSDVKPITIQVVALDWKWLFIYPEEGIATIGYVQFPEKTPINFHITSDAPMNSFWIPQLAGQIYAMAGMNTQLHVMADEPGVYLGVSSNFSGEGFSDMKFKTRVVTQNDFEQWRDEARLSPSTLTQEEYEKISKPSVKDPESTYGMVTEGLYNGIIMKYMMPMNEGSVPVNAAEEIKAPHMDNMENSMLMPI